MGIKYIISAHGEDPNTQIETLEYNGAIYFYIGPR